jgi:hypothetical protein
VTGFQLFSLACEVTRFLTFKAVAAYLFVSTTSSSKMSSSSVVVNLLKYSNGVIFGCKSTSPLSAIKVGSLATTNEWGQEQ